MNKLYLYTFLQTIGKVLFYLKSYLVMLLQVTTGMFWSSTLVVKPQCPILVMWLCSSALCVAKQMLRRTTCWTMWREFTSLNHLSTAVSTVTKLWKLRMLSISMCSTFTNIWSRSEHYYSFALKIQWNTLWTRYLCPMLWNLRQPYLDSPGLRIA